MSPDQQVVTRLPLVELWDARGALPIERRNSVDLEQMTNLLRNGRVRFVVANCGEALKWIPLNDCYRFWKEEVRPQLVEPAAAERGFRLAD